MGDNYFADACMKKAFGAARLRKLHPKLAGRLSRRLVEVAGQAGGDADVHRYSRSRIDALRRRGTDVNVELQRAERLANDRLVIEGAQRVVGIHFSLPGPKPTCLVLSGGAFKGSFEVGFLAYFQRLWDAFAVDAVVGTSVGAINAIALAQDGKAGVGRLTRLWLGLTGDEDMYCKHPTLDEVDLLLQAHIGVGVEELIADGGFQAIQETLLASFADELALTGTGLGTAFLGAAAGGPWGLLLLGLGALLGGIAAVKGKDEADAKIQGVKTAVEKLMAAPGLKEFLGLKAKLAAEVDPAGLGGPGHPKLRLALVRLEDGAVYYFTEDFKLLKDHPLAAEATEVWDMANQPRKQTAVDAVLASSSPPVLFPPVRLAKLNAAGAVSSTGLFIDGGVRETLPLKAAFEMGYERVVGLLTSPRVVPGWKASKASPPIAEVGLRTLPIVLAEIAETDLAEAKRRAGVDVTLRYPLMDVYPDAFSVDPGLIRINMAYGYMHGWLATLAAAGKNLEGWYGIITALAIEALAVLRHETWQLEDSGIRDGAFDAGSLAKIRANKELVLTYVESLYGVDPDLIPLVFDDGGAGERVKTWWLGFERHKSGTGAACLNARKPFERQPVWTVVSGGVSIPVVETSEPAAPESSIAALNQ